MNQEEFLKVNNSIQQIASPISYSNHFQFNFSQLDDDDSEDFGFFVQNSYKKPKIQMFNMNYSLIQSENQIREQEELLEHLYQNEKMTQSRPNEDLTFQSKDSKCNCNRSQCLKLYCSCFRKGIQCSSECSCTDCLNNTTIKREMAVEKIKEKYGEQNKFDEASFSGCNCKKSKCQKMYCECLIKGLKCGDFCKCSRCQNGKISKYQLKAKGNNKKISS